jgi:hypothetical protein
VRATQLFSFAIMTFLNSYAYADASSKSQSYIPYITYESQVEYQYDLPVQSSVDLINSGISDITSRASDLNISGENFR